MARQYRAPIAMDTASAQTSRGSAGLNIENIRLMVDADLTMAAADHAIYTSVTLTGIRTVTLCAANAVNKGHPLVVSDAFGAINGFNFVSIAPAGTDTIDGVAATTAVNAVRSSCILQSDGVSNWVTLVPSTVGIGLGGTGAQTKAAAFKALSPQTTRGDLIVENATPTPIRLAVGAANTVLRSNGTDPAYAALIGASMQLVPTGAIAQTVPRHNAGTNFAALVSAQMLLVGIWLPADTVITSITFVSGTTALGTGVNQWFGLYNSARGKLAVTGDDTSTAWGASTAKTLNLAAPFTTTYEGLHYLACMVKATTVPSLVGVTATPATKDIAPILSGLSTAALTNPASAPATAAAITTGQTAVEYAYVS